MPPVDGCAAAAVGETHFLVGAADRGQPAEEEVGQVSKVLSQWRVMRKRSVELCSSATGQKNEDDE